MTDTTPMPARAGARPLRSGRAAGTPRYRRLLASVVVAGMALAAVVAVPASAYAAVVTTGHQRHIVSGSSAVSSASLTLTVPAGVNTVAGRHLVLAYVYSGVSGDSVRSVTDSKGNSYRTDVVKQNAGSSELTVVVASARISAPLVGGDTVTVTQSTSRTYPAMQV
jgi:hypothetical protein